MRLFFRHCETVQSSHFFEIFLLVQPSIFGYFATEWMLKESQRLPPSKFFGTMRLTGDFKKISKKNGKISFLRAFVVSSCRKSGFRVLLSFRYGADLGRSRLVNFGILYTKCIYFSVNYGQVQVN